MEDRENMSEGDFDRYQPSDYGSGEENTAGSHRSPLRGVAQAPDPHVYNGLVQSEADFHHREAEKHRRILALINSPRNPDDTLPKNDQDKCRLVEKLFVAFNNTENIIDRNLKGGKLAQSARKILVGGHPAIEIEMALWRVVKGMIECQFGERMTAIHHGRRFEDYTTFADRFDKVHEAILVSKAICKQIMDASYLGRMVDAPATELRSKLNNGELNGMRNTQNEIGRQFTSRGLNVAYAQQVLGSSKDEVKLESSPVKSSGRKATYKKTARGAIAKKSTPKRASSGTTGRKKNNKREESPEHNTDPELEEYPLSDSFQGSHGFPSPLQDNGANAVNFENADNANYSDVDGYSNLNLIPNADFGNDGGFSQNPSPEHARMREEHFYCHALCDMLAIPRDLARYYSLRDLRIYARAINSAWSDTNWRVSEMRPEDIGVMFYIWSSDGSRKTLVDYFQHFDQLAHARGDFVNGVYNPNLVNLNPDQADIRANILGDRPNLFSMMDYSS